MPLRPGASVGRGDIPAVAMRLTGVGAGPSHGIAPGMAIAIWNNEDAKRIDIVTKDMVAICCCYPEPPPRVTAVDSTRREKEETRSRKTQAPHIGVCLLICSSGLSRRLGSRAWLEERLGGRIGSRGVCCERFQIVTCMRAMQL